MDTLPFIVQCDVTTDDGFLAEIGTTPFNRWNFPEEFEKGDERPLFRSHPSFQGDQPDFVDGDSPNITYYSWLLEFDSYGDLIDALSFMPSDQLKKLEELEGDTMNWDELHDYLVENVVPYLVVQWGEDDTDAIRQGINNTMDAMCKDGEISSWTDRSWSYDEGKMIDDARRKGHLRQAREGGL
jgi:hypothetical protein